MTQAFIYDAVRTPRGACRTLAAAHGVRFAPPELLEDMARTGETFHHA